MNIVILSLDSIFISLCFVSYLYLYLRIVKHVKTHDIHWHDDLGHQGCKIVHLNAVSMTRIIYQIIVTLYICYVPYYYYYYCCCCCCWFVIQFETKYLQSSILHRNEYLCNNHKLTCSCQFNHECHYPFKGEFRAQYKLGSNERAWKIQKNEPSLTFMCQLVLEISQFKVIFSPHKDAAIFMILSLVPIKRKWNMTS